MPFVRITLSTSWNEDTRNLFSLSVHQALIEEFNIPQDDYFHIIEAQPPQQIKHPKEYLGITYSDDIIFIQIIAATGRTSEQKKKLYKKIAVLIRSQVAIDPNNIVILLIENQKENWSFGQGEMQAFHHI